MSLRCRLGVHLFSLRQHDLPSGDYLLLMDQCLRCSLIDSWGVLKIDTPDAVVIMHELSMN